ncbi:MAG: polysaccharide deacetylase family protein, partial [Verrucomicrobiota bacterium]
MKRPATLSLDLDNQWAYMKTHGDAGWERFPTYLDRVVPRILGILDELDLEITFFVVGKDAADERNADALQSLADAGHEIANHSYWHEPWFDQYDCQETEAEVEKAEQAIELATGVRPRGWRGPGFNFTPVLLEVLGSRGYSYDASTFPTYLGPMARLYYLATSGLKGEEREKRSGLYGSWTDGFRSLGPYFWNLENRRPLLEIPVTTAPFLRTPIHASYLLYLATFQPTVADVYWEMALRACGWRGI